jgi:hypothetical protein
MEEEGSRGKYADVGVVAKYLTTSIKRDRASFLRIGEGCSRELGDSETNDALGRRKKRYREGD